MKNFFLFIIFFVIAEYALVTLILRSFIDKKVIKNIMLLTIFLFTFFSLYISFKIEYLNVFPSININIEGLLLITWCTFSFVLIQPFIHVTIFKRPVFWITVAFFIYFAGTLSVNSIYNTLLEKDKKIAESIFAVFNSAFNYFLYIFLSIGIISFKWEEKYLVQ